MGIWAAGIEHPSSGLPRNWTQSFESLVLKSVWKYVRGDAVSGTNPTRAGMLKWGILQHTSTSRIKRLQTPFCKLDPASIIHCCTANHPRVTSLRQCTSSNNSCEWAIWGPLASASAQNLSWGCSQAVHLGHGHLRAWLGRTCFPAHRWRCRQARVLHAGLHRRPPDRPLPPPRVNVPRKSKIVPTLRLWPFYNPPSEGTLRRFCCTLSTRTAMNSRPCLRY